MFPYPHSTEETPRTAKLYFGNRQTKVLNTSVKSIARFVGKIIADPRTLNQTVVTSDVESTVDEAWSIAAKVTGEDFSDYPRVRALSAWTVVLSSLSVIASGRRDRRADNE